MSKKIWIILAIVVALIIIGVLSVILKECPKDYGELRVPIDAQKAVVE